MPVDRGSGSKLDRIKKSGELSSPFDFCFLFFFSLSLSPSIEEKEDKT